MTGGQKLIVEILEAHNMRMFMIDEEGLNKVVMMIEVMMRKMLSMGMMIKEVPVDMKILTGEVLHVLMV